MNDIQDKLRSPLGSLLLLADEKGSDGVVVLTDRNILLMDGIGDGCGRLR